MSWAYMQNQQGLVGVIFLFTILVNNLRKKDL